MGANISSGSSAEIEDGQRKTTEGRWSNEDVKKLFEYWKQGLSNAEIAKKLGRGESAVAVKASRCNLPPKRKAGSENVKNGNARQRSCLRCRSPFMSDGPGNRICDPCRESSDWQSGGDYYTSIGGF